MAKLGTFAAENPEKPRKALQSEAYRAQIRKEREQREANQRYGYEVTVKGDYEGTIYNDNKAEAYNEAAALLGHTNFSLRKVKVAGSRKNPTVFWVFETAKPAKAVEYTTLAAAEKACETLNKRAGYEKFQVTGFDRHY